MRRRFISLVKLSALACVSACGPVGPGQNEINLPQGDASQGEQEFVSLGCVSCHIVSGAELPEPAATGRRVLLGTRRMSYGELVTSVVNPSHRLSPRYRRDEVSRDRESLMTSYNDVMTVTQLTDIVAFLQAHHESTPRPGYTYPVYRYGAGGESENADSQ